MEEGDECGFSAQWSAELAAAIEKDYAQKDSSNHSLHSMKYFREFVNKMKTLDEGQIVWALGNVGACFSKAFLQSIQFKCDDPNQLSYVAFDRTERIVLGNLKHETINKFIGRTVLVTRDSDVDFMTVGRVSESPGAKKVMVGLIDDNWSRLHLVIFVLRKYNVMLIVDAQSMFGTIIDGTTGASNQKNFFYTASLSSPFSVTLRPKEVNRINLVTLTISLGGQELLTAKKLEKEEIPQTVAMSVTAPSVVVEQQPPGKTALLVVVEQRPPGKTASSVFIERQPPGKTTTSTTSIAAYFLLGALCLGGVVWFIKKK